MAALGAPGDFPAAEQDIARGPALKTKKLGFPIRIRPGANLSEGAESAESGDPRRMDQLIPVKWRLTRPVRHGGSETIRDFLVMHDGAPACHPSHHGAMSAGGVLQPLSVVLEVSQRECWRLPAIDAKRYVRPLGSGPQERFIDGHIPGTGGGRIENEASGLHGIQSVGVHFKIGLRAAATSSGRLMTVLWGDS